MTGRTRRGRVLLGALLLAGAAGCTGAGDPAPQATERRTATAQPAAVAALRAAERATGRAGSARVESSTALGTDVSMTSAGTLAWDGGLTGALTITYTGGSIAETMRALGTTSMQARYLPDAYYARMGDAFAAKAGGRHWIRYAWDDLAGLGGASGAYLAEQIREAAPQQAVKLVLAAGDVRRVAVETVRGERTTRYRGTARAAEVTDPGLRERLRRAGVTEQTVDVWVDGEGLLVKKVEQDRTATGRVTQTCFYGDYGVRVSVAPPPPGDTQDFKDLMTPGPAAS
ncbi:hypothetical protein ABZZ79_25085 [Streptomyces sp. NPDC006458]|uniref:hypothetical protein n=1 Tax=Streptomyces sp. NPDC006458 TaxID=3154302 RepID=UPI0033B6A75A